MASDHGPPITVATTSAYLGGALSGYVTPVGVGAMSTVGSSNRPIIGSGTTSVTGSSVTSEGVFRASMPACPTEGMGATTGGA